MTTWFRFETDLHDDVAPFVFQLNNNQTGVGIFEEYKPFQCRKCRRLDWYRALRSGIVHVLGPDEESPVMSSSLDCFLSYDHAIVVSERLRNAVAGLAGEAILSIRISERCNRYLLLPVELLECPQDAPYGAGPSDSLRWIKNQEGPFLRKSIFCVQCGKATYAFNADLFTPQGNSEIVGLLAGDRPYQTLSMFVSDRIAGALSDHGFTGLNFKACPAKERPQSW